MYVGIWSNRFDPTHHFVAFLQHLKTLDDKPTFYGINIECGELRGNFLVYSGQMFQFH